MDIMNRVNKTISDAGQKTRNAADIANLNKDISNNKKKIDQLYGQLGELYYNAHSDAPEQGFQEVVSNITELQDQINDWNDQIQELKGFIKCPNCGEYVEGTARACPNCGESLLPEGAKVCPNCGAVITDQDVKFCQYCGARLDDPSKSEQTVIHQPGPIQCKCGAILEKDDMFCSRCGTSRKELEQAQYNNTEQ